MTEIEIRLHEEDVCDFCSTPKPKHKYRTLDFRVQTGSLPEDMRPPDYFHLNSIGEWLACDNCKSLIDSDRWEELIQHNARRMAELHGVRLESTLVWVRSLYEEFRRARL